MPSCACPGLIAGSGPKGPKTPSACPNPGGKTGEEENPIMKSDKGNQITPLQGAAIVASSLIGVGILTLPREVAAAAGTDGPLATLLGGAIAALLLVLLTKLGLRFPGHSLIEYSSIILGGIVGKLLALAFIIYWFLSPPPWSGSLGRWSSPPSYQHTPGNNYRYHAPFGSPVGSPRCQGLARSTRFFFP